MSGLDFAAPVSAAAASVPANRDRRRLVTGGVLLAVDTAGNRVQVSCEGGDPQWMPFLPGEYDLGQTVYVLRNQLSGEYEMCLGPTQGNPQIVPATLSAINTGTARATVTWSGSSYGSLPYLPSTYTVGSDVFVALDATLGGVPTLVLGAPSQPAPAAVVKPTPTPAPPPRPTTVTRTATILPAWSGTYRADQGRWNQWNANRNGVDTLWEGAGYGASGLRGFAGYGNRFTDLGALTIVKVTVTLRGGNASAGSYPSVTLQGTPSGSQPAGNPSVSGDTVVSPAVPRTGVVYVDLTSNMCEALRTGTARGLCLVGSGYAAVRGTSAPDGMACNVVYTTAG